MSFTSRARFALGAFVATALAALALTGLLLYPRFKQISLEPPRDRPTTSATVARSLDDVRTGLEAASANGVDLGFRSAPDGTSRRIRPQFRLFPAGHGMFPDDFQLRVWSEGDPDLRAYVDLPRPARSKDFFLVEPTGDYYWFSEYRYRGQPAKFHCAFVLHLAPADASRTRIEILEYLPTIWVGEKFGWSAHTGPFPGFFYDIRFVGPTTADRAVVLAKVLGLLTSD